MDRTRPLREILDELHRALEASDEIGEEGRAALEQAAHDIREALEEPGGGSGPGLRDQLSQALERFEGQHPRLTELVGRIADALSDLGI